MSLREQILAKSARKAKRVTPSFLDGQEVEIREMNVAERQGVINGSMRVTKVIEDGEVIEKRDMDSAELEALVVIACTFDPGTGAKVFEDGDREALVAMSSSVLDELAAPALVLNGLAVRTVETARKNSSATLT
jgi:hypothetical protein